MQIIEDKTLLLRTRNPDKIQSKIPTSKVVDITEDIYTMTVDWDLPTTQRLAGLKNEKHT